MKVMGVDFSGADEKRGSNTWITQGQLENDKLSIECCRPTTRAELENILKDKDLPDNTVAAMDFPFSVPKAFADYWKPGSKTMPDLWSAAAAIDWNDFRTKCKDYMNGQKRGDKHPLRIGDLHSNEPKSCLNTRIMPMTFHGMNTLRRLWKSDTRFRVPPLNESGRNGPVLLEVMPGAALEAFQLPSDRYKNVTKTISRLQIEENRKKILLELEAQSGVEIVNLDYFGSGSCGRSMGIRLGPVPSPD